MYKSSDHEYRSFSLLTRQAPVEGFLARHAIHCCCTFFRPCDVMRKKDAKRMLLFCGADGVRGVGWFVGFFTKNCLAPPAVPFSVLDAKQKCFLSAFCCRRCEALVGFLQSNQLCDHGLVTTTTTAALRRVALVRESSAWSGGNLMLRICRDARSMVYELWIGMTHSSK